MNERQRLLDYMDKKNKPSMETYYFEANTGGVLRHEVTLIMSANNVGKSHVLDLYNDSLTWKYNDQM